MTTTKLADKVAQSNGANPPDIEIIDVGPALAREWMKRNETNRNVRDKKVQQYAADMKIGDWRWTGESVKFDSNGNLIDGQHRLTAIVLSETTVKMLVVRNLEPEAQEELDQGIPRLFHDVLRLRGETNSHLLAAIIRRIHLWSQGQRRGFAGSAAIGTPSLLRTLNSNPQLRDIANRSHAYAGRCDIPGSVIGTAIWLFEQLDADDCKHFFDRLCDGQNMAKGDPIYELRRTLAGTKEVRGERSQAYLMAVTIKAWNAFRENRQVGLYRWKQGGAHPEQFPEPI